MADADAVPPDVEQEFLDALNAEADEIEADLLDEMRAVAEDQAGLPALIREALSAQLPEDPHLVIGDPQGLAAVIQCSTGNTLYAREAFEGLAAPYQRAAVAVFEGEGLVWAIRPRDRAVWSLPGGHLDPGERPVDAAEREAYEEAGLYLTRLRYLGRLYRPWSTTHVFVAERSGEPVYPGTPEEVDGVQLVALDDLDAVERAFLIRHARGLRPGREAFDPSQPREPAGGPDGGQWTAAGGSGSGDSDAGSPAGAGGRAKQRPPAVIPGFRWGSGDDDPDYDEDLFVRIGSRPISDLRRGYSYTAGAFGDRGQAHAGLSGYSVTDRGYRGALDELDQVMGVGGASAGGGPRHVTLFAGRTVGTGPDGEELFRPTRIIATLRTDDTDQYLDVDSAAQGLKRLAQRRSSRSTDRGSQRPAEKG